jgi:hypothetical protein
MCIYIYNKETFTESMKTDKLFLSRWHSLLKRRPSTGSFPVTNNAGGEVQIAGNHLKKSSHEAWREKDISFPYRVTSQQTNVLLIILRLIFAARCLSESMSSNTFIPVSTGPCPSDSFDIFLVQFLNSGLGSSASSAFSRGSLISNLKKLVKIQLMIMLLQQLYLHLQRLT